MVIVMKFGGSSLKDAEGFSQVASIIESHLLEKPVVVLSALGKTTDNLLHAGQEALHQRISLTEVEKTHYSIAKELELDTSSLDSFFREINDLLTGISLVKEISPGIKASLVSYGERLAVRLFTAYFEKKGHPSQYHDAWDIGFVLKDDQLSSAVISDLYIPVKKSLGDLETDYHHTLFITGFIAKHADGHILTLGRGGSDLTASVLSVALEAKEMTVWKDVDGILTSDPKYVNNPKTISMISFEEASELSYFGAKVLQPGSILPAMKANIPVRVRNTYHPDYPGTTIVSELKEEPPLVRAITMKKNVTLVDITSTRMLGNYGFLSTVFQAFAHHKVSVDVVATSEVSISLTLDNGNDMEDIRQELGKMAKVAVSRKNKAIISIIGDVKRSSEILSKVFSALKEMKVNVQMISQGASKVNISFLIENDEAEKVINHLHTLFFSRV